MPLLGEALISNVGLKALLPSVPKIIPQLPTLNQTVVVEAAPPCNETEINANRTADQERLTCNATANATQQQQQTANLPGLKFFDNLKKMNEDFMKETSKPSPSPSPKPAQKPSPVGKKPSGSGSGVKPKSGDSSGSGGGGGASKPADSKQADSTPKSSPKLSPQASPKPSVSPKLML